jgi:hypothetical protein
VDDADKIADAVPKGIAVSPVFSNFCIIIRFKGCIIFTTLCFNEEQVRNKVKYISEKISYGDMLLQIACAADQRRGILFFLREFL